MSRKTKKQNSVLEPKTLIVTGLASLAAILVAVIMTSVFLPKDEVIETANNIDMSAWESATKEVLDPETPDYEESVPTMNTEEPAPEVSAPENDTFIMPVNGSVIKDYSGEELVYSETMQDFRTHNGIDFAANEGDDVVAVFEGTVEAITDNGMYGTTVIILHKDGLRSIYSNLVDNLVIAEGDAVARGGIIGKVGSTAAAEVAEPPHLHFEMSLNEEIVNPHDYLPTGNSEE